MKEKADKVASLLEQAREARTRSNFGAASELIDKALQLDERNTDLRNERARILQESERASRERTRREFSDAARGQLAARQYTEAIKNLRAALEIDPTDTETQQLYQDAVDRQEEQRRRKIIDQIVAEISECISSDELERALALIQRAQERLPGEAVLLQLKVDAETRQREQAAKKLVEKTSLQVYDLFPTNPQEALTAVRQALEQMPGEPRLIALEEKAVEQLRKASTGERKAQYLKQAQASIDAKQFDEAIQILESAAIECGENPDIASLLNYAREQKRTVELRQAAANATREAQALIAAGKFEEAIALLQPVAQETGDASVEQLLRQASGSLADLTRRIDAVVSRAQALGGKNIEQASQLLSSQPQDVQQHSRVRELRARLDAAKENEGKAKQAGAAIPMQEAPSTQVTIRQDKPRSEPVKARRSSRVPLLIGCIVMVVLGAAGAAFWFLRPAPAAPMGVLELNAIPFAEVVSVTSDKGKAIPLPAGDHWTPLRLDEIPAGRYDVSLQGIRRKHPDSTMRCGSIPSGMQYRIEAYRRYGDRENHRRGKMILRPAIFIFCLILSAAPAPALHAEDNPKKQAKDLAEKAKGEGSDRAKQVQDLCAAAQLDPKEKKYADTCNSYRSGLVEDDTAALVIALSAYKSHDLDRAESQARLVTNYDAKLSGQARFLLDRIKNEKLLRQVQAAWTRGDFQAVNTLAQGITNSDIKAAANAYVNNVNLYKGYIDQAQKVEQSNPQEAIKQLTLAKELNPNGPDNPAGMIADLQRAMQAKNSRLRRLPHPSPR